MRSSTARRRGDRERLQGSPLARLGGPPEAVAKAIEKALRAKRPRARYKVTPSAKLLIARAADASPQLGHRDALPVPPAGPMSDAARLAERAAREGRFGIDTEFMPEGRYRPLLCLVQVCVGGEIAVLDPFEGFDPAPFAEVLRTRGSRWCCTPAARTWRSCGGSGAARSRTCSTRRSRPCFAGFAAQAASTGLLHDVLKIRVAKTASFTRWDARPLTQEQVSYVREDVEHLLPLLDQIQKRLLSTGRLEWAREECRAIAASSDERDPDEVWRRLPRATGLDPRERAVARALGAWRERTASARTARRARSCATRRWSSWPSASPRGAASWARSAGSTRSWCAAGAPTSWTRSSAAAKRRRSASRRPSGCRRSPWTDRRSRSRRHSVRARAQEAGTAYELIAARART